MAKSTAVESSRTSAEPAMRFVVCLVAWAVPGAGHLWLRKTQKAVVFFVALLSMFGIGLALKGRLFPFDTSEPLVALAAVANLGLGLPWIIARAMDAGAGTVTAVTYEDGNTLIIVAGLLNFLVVLDAFDVAA